MNQCEDEERETAVDKDARVHFTLAILAIGSRDLSQSGALSYETPELRRLIGPKDSP